MNSTYPVYGSKRPIGESVRQLLPDGEVSYMALPSIPKEKNPLNGQEEKMSRRKLGIAAAVLFTTAGTGNLAWRQLHTQGASPENSTDGSELESVGTWYRTVGDGETVWKVIASAYPEADDEMIIDITYNHIVVQRDGNPYNEDTDVDNVNEGDVLKITYPQPEEPTLEN